MLERFRHIVEGMKRLIGENGSASFGHCGMLGGAKVLLAVSGGIDSMCLADLWLRCFGPESFAMAHCNFHLRGDESDGDEAFVSRWAEENGVQLHRTGFDTSWYAEEKGISIEMAARELRYGWFAQLCAGNRYAAVAVAHHADDNAETFILNMVRGAGLRGLSGMNPVSYLPVSCEDIGGEAASHPPLLLRPLLTFTRKQIEGYALRWKIPHREDSTNSSVEYRRNSIRHEVLPVFRRMNPSFVRTLNREMSYLSDALEIVGSWCRERVADVVAGGSAAAFSGSCNGAETDRCCEVVISIPRLLSVPQWRYLLYYILEPYGFNASVLEALENLLMSDRTLSGKRLESSAYVLSVERDELHVLRKDALTEAGDGRMLRVDGPGVYEFNGSAFRVSIVEWSPEMPLKQPSGVLIMDHSALDFPLVFRRWRQGDWMVPLGMTGKKKISDLFADLKYTSAMKDRTVVFSGNDAAEDDPHVAGVLGVRPDMRYKVTASSRTVLKMETLNNFLINEKYI